MHISIENHTNVTQFLIYINQIHLYLLKTCTLEAAELPAKAAGGAAAHSDGKWGVDVLKSGLNSIFTVDGFVRSQILGFSINFQIK